MQEASKLVADEMKLQRVQLLGTDRTEELQHVWTQFFYEVKHGRIDVRDFEAVSYTHLDVYKRQRQDR